MKTLPLIFLGFISFIPFKKLAAQETDSGKLETLISSKQYTFLAETAVPSSLRTRSLEFGYDLQLSPDSIISYLPYFGRAYSAPMDPLKGGIQFTSVNFSYQVEERKKGGWNVVIVPKDQGEVQQMYLHITEKGFATLQVVSTNRQTISFHGRIRERKYPRAF